MVGECGGGSHGGGAYGIFPWGKEEKIQILVKEKLGTEPSFYSFMRVGEMLTFKKIFVIIKMFKNDNISFNNKIYLM